MQSLVKFVVGVGLTDGSFDAWGQLNKTFTRQCNLQV